MLFVYTLFPVAIFRPLWAKWDIRDRSWMTGFQIFPKFNCGWENLVRKSKTGWKQQNFPVHKRNKPWRPPKVGWEGLCHSWHIMFFREFGFVVCSVWWVFATFCHGSLIKQACSALQKCSCPFLTFFFFYILPPDNHKLKCILLSFLFSTKAKFMESVILVVLWTDSPTWDLNICSSFRLSV